VVSDLTTFLSSDMLIAIELQAENAIKRWADMAGPTDPAIARQVQVAPTCFRARYGTGNYALVTDFHSLGYSQFDLCCSCGCLSSYSLKLETQKLHVVWGSLSLD